MFFFLFLGEHFLLSGILVTMFLYLVVESQGHEVVDAYRFPLDQRASEKRELSSENFFAVGFLSCRRMLLQLLLLSYSLISSRT